MTPVISAAARVPVFARYLGASGVALGFDLTVFAAAIASGLPAGAAAAAGYSAGIALHWWLSSRGVFTGALAAPGRARARQQALFVATALVGLALTTAIVTVLARLGVAAGVARAAAIALSFVTTYGLRRLFVFA